MTTTGKKVLIVEDERPLSKALQLKFSKEGYIADVANDGEEALQMIETTKYDVVLLDLVMPKKDGFELLSDLNAKGIKVPVIVVSNLGQEEDIEKTKKFGVKGYLIKANSTLEDIVNTINKFLA